LHRLRGNSCCRCRHVAAIHAADNRSYVGGANEESIRVGWGGVAPSRVGDRLGRQDSRLAIAEASILVSMPRTKAHQAPNSKGSGPTTTTRPNFCGSDLGGRRQCTSPGLGQLCSARAVTKSNSRSVSIRFSTSRILKCNVYGIESCEFSLSSPVWPGYQCRPVANAFRLRAPSGPCILDHIRTGGCGCQAMWATNVGTPKIQPTCWRRAFKRGGCKILHAERGRTRKRMVRRNG
jgi:hypothetical protein